MAGVSYSIKKNRIQGGYHPGFDMLEDGTLVSIPGEASHSLYLKAIDSAVFDSSWGRLKFRAACSENMVLYLYAIALNEDSFYRQGRPVRIEDFLCDSGESPSIKKEFLRKVEAVRFVNQKDMLLYQLHGRYLYLVLEAVGEGECRIWDMKADLKGDPFMDTFPEIYRERNGFFHRYLSVFSSIYQDFQEDIEKLPELLNLDTCPEKLLPIYGRWLGIDVGNDFLDARILRPLVKEAYRLNRMKGTKAALERIAEIVLGAPVLVAERNVIEDYIDKEQLAEFDRLYGHSIYDVTILVQEPIPEVVKSQLLFLLEQFKPLRSRLHVVHLKKDGILDSYSYLDMNARISSPGTGSLDGKQELDGMVRLQ